ncbi:MAG: histidine phosphatase family protein [bacterium]|nr:histidine phosphatase family protein [bacterium]
MLVHITRHGQVLPAGADTWSHADYPHGDPPLSRLGHQQAHLLGKRLATLGFQGRIYSSPYRRTVETACAIADVVGVDVEPAAPLREIVKKAEQMQGFVGMTGPLLATVHPRIMVPGDFHDEWWTTGAETDAAVEARVAPFVDSLLGGSDDVLLVGHGASTGGVIDHLLRKFAPQEIREPTPGWNCALTTFHNTDSLRMLTRMDAEHLPEDHVTSNAQSRADVVKSANAQG